MSLKMPRPADPLLHPLVTGNYPLATPAIESVYELVTRCLRYRIMGPLIYGPSRIGKTRAIEYLRLPLAREYPKITTYHAQCEHKPRHAEGPFFSTMLEAVDDTFRNAGTTSAKRSRLALRIREVAARAGSGTVMLFCDEAQRLNDHEYEWLRDVHDALGRQQIKLFTFLVGQEELLAQKTALQVAHKTQIGEMFGLYFYYEIRITRYTSPNSTCSLPKLAVCCPAFDIRSALCRETLEKIGSKNARSPLSTLAFPTFLA